MIDIAEKDIIRFDEKIGSYSCLTLSVKEYVNFLGEWKLMYEDGTYCGTAEEHFILLNAALIGGPRFGKTVIIGTPPSSSGGCSIIDEFNEIQAQVNTNLYCYCYKPDIIINAAGGETFKYCKTCKKEKK